MSRVYDEPSMNGSLAVVSSFRCRDNYSDLFFLLHVKYKKKIKLLQLFIDDRLYYLWHCSVTAAGLEQLPPGHRQPRHHHHCSRCPAVTVLLSGVGGWRKSSCSTIPMIPDSDSTSSLFLGATVARAKARGREGLRLPQSPSTCESSTPQRSWTA